MWQYVVKCIFNVVQAPIKQSKGRCMDMFDDYGTHSTHWVHTECQHRLVERKTRHYLLSTDARNE